MLRVIKDLDVNKVSDEVKKYITDRGLKPGQTVKYRLLNGTKNQDKEKNDGPVLYPSSVSIPLTDKIWDPGHNALVTVGVIRDVDRDGNITYKKHFVYPVKNEGTFTLTGSNSDHIEIYEVLELISLNKTSPYRSEKVHPLFERIDEVAESKAKSQRRNVLRDSLNAIANWDMDELRAAGAAYNIPIDLDKDVIRERLEDIAEKDPVTFYKTIDNEETKTKGLINVAKQRGVISYNAHEHTWTMTGSGELIGALARTEGLDETTQFAQLLMTGANGAKIKKNIEKILKNTD